MNEQEFMASEDPGAMLECVGHDANPAVRRASPRKLRLFACACARLCWDRLTDARSRKAVEVAERYADGLASEDERAFAEAQARAAGVAVPRPQWVVTYVAALAVQGGDLFDPADVAYQATKMGLPPAAQAALLRDVCGSPFRPVLSLDEHGWVKDRRSLDLVLSWRLNPGVQALARAAYAEGREVECEACRGYGRRWYCRFCRGEWLGEVGDGCVDCDNGLPLERKDCPDCAGTGRTSDGLLDPDRLLILADALEEAGADSEDLLRHLRGREPCPQCYLATPPWCTRCGGTGWASLRGPHARGCWAVDLLLGRA